MDLRKELESLPVEDLRAYIQITSEKYTHYERCLMMACEIIELVHGEEL